MVTRVLYRERRGGGVEISRRGQPGHSKALNSPAFSVNAADERVGLADIGYFQLGRVPLERHTGKSCCETTEEDRLGKGPGIIERRRRLAIPAACFDELQIV